MRRSLLRLAALLVLVTVLPSCGDKVTNVTNQSIAKATPDVAVFANTTYIDYIVGNIGSEGSNLVATFQFLKLTVSPFFGTTADEFLAATQGRRILAIPETENGDFSADITQDTRQAIATFVNDGGTLLVFVNDSNNRNLLLVNGIFGSSLALGVTTGPFSLNVAGVAGTPFAGGPSTIPSNDGPNSVLKTSLPSNAVIVYAEASAAGDAMVTYFPFGKGFVVLLGWDWYDAKPVGSQDGGWVDVLNRAGKL